MKAAVLDLYSALVRECSYDEDGDAAAIVAAARASGASDRDVAAGIIAYVQNAAFSGDNEAERAAAEAADVLAALMV